MSEQRLNIELFKKIREKIATAPEAYDQETYGRREGDTPCGTAACIAGWACVLADRVSVNTLQNQRSFPGLDVPVLASEVLNPTDDEGDVLFTGSPDWEDSEGDVNSWPEPFASEWSDSKSLRDDVRITEQARIAVAYLDHIIASGKVLE